jgi:hypothetical protein
MTRHLGPDGGCRFRGVEGPRLRRPDGQERRLSSLDRELLADISVVARERRRLGAPDGLGRPHHQRRVVEWVTR